MTVLELSQVSKTYNPGAPGEVKALKTASLLIEQGDFVSITGPSGAGKSTLLNVLALLDPPSKGKYFIDDLDATKLSDSQLAALRAHTFSFVFQAFHLIDERTVTENVALGLMYSGDAAGSGEETVQITDTQRIEQALNFVGLTHKQHAKAVQLSGGERQRVAIARAIVAANPVLVADEPTGNLDSANSRSVMRVLDKLNQSGTTVIVVTHDPKVAAHAKTRIEVHDGVVTVPESESLKPLKPAKTTHAAQAKNPKTSSKKTSLRAILADARRTITAKPAASGALIAGVLLAVALALATVGISEAARAQVSQLFDAARNQRVAVSVPEPKQLTKDGSVKQASTTTLMRLKRIPGVERAQIYSNHGNQNISLTSDTKGQNFDVLGATDPSVPGLEIEGKESAKTSGIKLGPGQVLVGRGIANNLELGPVDASPVVWIANKAYVVVGVISDSGLDASIMNAVVMRETDAVAVGATNAVTAEIRTRPGAAQLVAQQAPIALDPYTGENAHVDAPEDPKTMRQSVESNVRTMLVTLTAVSLLAAVLMLTNSTATAVSRRSGEFGLRRAMGARRWQIAALVTAESAIVGLIGGVIGTFTAVVVIISTVLVRHWQPVLDLRLLPVGIIGGMVVGLVGCLLAVRRAAGVSPADALRQ